MLDRPPARLFTRLCILATMALATAPLWAAVPRTIPFQALIKTASGQPLTTAAPVTFTLYDANGAALWSDTKTLTPANGLIDTRLGDTPGNPIPTGVLFQEPYTIGVKVGNDAEMTPRVPLAAVPYALALPNVATDAGMGYVGLGTPAPLGALDVVAYPKAPGGEMVDQQQIQIGNGFGAQPTLAIGQTFTAGQTGSLTRIALHIGHQGGGAWSAVLRVYATPLPTGTPASTTDFSGSGDIAPVTVALSQALPVVLGGHYSFDVLAGTGTDMVQMDGAGNFYPLGSLTLPGGSLFTDYDLWFQTFVSIPAGVTPRHALYVSRETGNVGIGTMTPLAPLHVTNTTFPTAVVESSSPIGTWLSLRNTGTDPSGQTVGHNWNLISSSVSNGEGAGGLLFNDQTTGATRMLIDAGGNVGIGTDHPVRRLQVAGSGIFLGSNAAGSTQFAVDLSDPSGGYVMMQAVKGAGVEYGDIVLNPISGRVGIGKVPDYALDVQGQIRADNVAVVSDGRLKTDIRPIPDGLDTILRLRGVSYLRKARPDGPASGGRQVGLIAQEVEKVVPEVVSTDEAGYKAISYQALVPVLVEAVKTLQSENDALKHQNETLDARLRRLEREEATRGR